MSVCKCNIGLSNTGTPNCVPIMSVTKKIVMVPYYDNDGVVNFVDCTSTLDEAYFDAKLNNVDRSKRWFPLPEIKNVEDVKGESVFESFNDGSNLFIQEGTRTFNGLMPNQSPEFLGQIKSATCVKFGVFIIDKNGNLIGNGKVDGKLYPILVDNQTWNAILMKTTDTTVQKISFSFEYSRIERDEDLRMLSSDDVIDYDLLEVRGIVDVKLIGITSNAGADSISFVAETIYGTQCDKVRIGGLDPLDFAVTVNGLPVTVLTVTEAINGSYVLVLNTNLVATDTYVVKISKLYLEVSSGNTGIV